MMMMMMVMILLGPYWLGSEATVTTNSDSNCDDYDSRSAMSVFEELFGQESL